MVYASAPETLITTYLEITDPSNCSRCGDAPKGARIEEMTTPDVDFYRYMYREVGWEWRWRDRLYISDDQLHSILEDDNTRVFVIFVGNKPAGYVELARQGSSVEIAYFGLRSQFMGLGLGKYLLSYGIEKAWEMGAERIWVHTCNLDGPHALTNYQKRGFRVYQRHSQEMPEIYAS